MDKKYRYFTPRVDLNSVRFKLARNGSSENFEFAPIIRRTDLIPIHFIAPLNNPLRTQQCKYLL